MDRLRQSRLLLLQEHQLPRLTELPCLQPGEVDAGGKVRAIEGDAVRTGGIPGL